MNRVRIFCLIFFLFAVVVAMAGNFVWFDGKMPVSYAVSKDCSPIVLTAIEMWKDDMLQVSGKIPFNSLGGSKSTVRIVQLGEESSDELTELGVPIGDLSANKEAFWIGIVRNQLLVVGSDPRGTVYGVLELSRLAGVSPWVWWGDVTPERKMELTLPTDFQTFQHPSVEFRGIFINDEDWSSMPWANENFAYKLTDSLQLSSGKRWKGAIGPKAYEKLFQLLLRLRANTVWPAMHECSVPFYFVEGNRQMAEKYGVTVGTSHCEPLMCNAASEWDVRGKDDYNYITNKHAVIDFWTERLEELKNSENIFTVGMRGKHDGSMEGVQTMREKTDALQQVIYDQRELLTRYVNSDAGKIPQQFVPYKEVLDIYENGLDVPNDIMLTWCDDNYGYLTRLSDSVQQQRSGGAGVYYHLSYWGRPHDYLWLTTTQPGLIYHEMKNAFAHHARRLWIANVHDVKPAAYDLELFLDLAWNINAVTNVSAHLQRWLCRDFGLDAGEKLFPAMHDFYRLTAIRKPEFMGWNQVELDKTVYPRGWSPVASTEFGAETAQYLQNYENSKQIILDVEKIIPPNRQDAFFAAIKYPVLCAAAMAAKWLEYQQGNYSASLKAYSEIVELTGYYNNTMSGGKWKNSMSASPRNLHVFDRPNTDAPSASSQPETERMNTGQHVIARNASNFSSADADAHPVQMLGHSMNAVALPKGSSLVYEFETEQAGMAVLRTAVIPTHPNDKGDIRFSVQIDDENPQVISFCEKGRTEQWKQHVLRGQAVKTTKHTLAKGLHTLTVTALDNHVVIDQWMIDFDMDRKFYLFPVK